LLHVLDRDMVEKTNLANSLFLNERHIDLEKSEAAAEIARSWSLRKLNVRRASFDVADIDQWNRLNNLIGDADIVYGCFDNLPARFSLNSAAIVQDVKYIDLGIEGFSGRIRLIDRSRACYACDPLIPEHLSIKIYSLTKSRKGCDYAPTVTILPTAISTAAYAVIEGLKFLRILENHEQYDYLYYNFLTSERPVKMRISKQRDCKICGRDGLVNWSRP